MKILWIIIIMADNLLPLLLARFYPNYKHKEMALSVLGSRQSPVKWIYNVWCIISGVVFCIAPYALYQENDSGWAIAIWMLLAIYGIGCEIISGVCPLNENRQDEDIITKIHGGTSAIGFILACRSFALCNSAIPNNKSSVRRNFTGVLYNSIHILLLFYYG